MAMPCKPLARAAAIKSSGLEIPSPEKKECVCRSILNGIVRRLIWRTQHGKRWFQGMGHSLRGAGTRQAKYHSAQGAESLKAGADSVFGNTNFFYSRRSSTS